MKNLIPLLALILWSAASAAADKPHAVVVVGTHHYSPEKTMPNFAAELERLGFRTTVINPGWDPEKDKRGLPGLEALEKADVGIFFVRFLKLNDEQLAPITQFLEAGKPVVCFRTSTHAFNYPEDHPKHGLNQSFGREAFGTPYLIHLQGKTNVAPAEGANDHPILTGVKSESWISPGTLYLTKLEPGAKPLLMGTGSPNKPGVRTNQFGTHDLKAEMTDTTAWTWENQWGGRVFGTSLGHTGDFAVPESMRVMVNGVFWAAGRNIPDAKTEVRTFGSKPSAKPKKKPAPPKKASVEPKAEPAEKVTLFYGNSMVERLLEHGEMEARLQIAHPDEQLKIRSLAWTGDEVGNRLRLEGYVKHMKNLLEKWSAETVVLGYGLNESFAGKEGLADFERHYRQHLKQLSLTHPGARFVFLSPIAIEGGTEEQNENVKLYSDVIAKLAAENKADFVDLFSPTHEAYEESEAKLTGQGIHLNASGNEVIAKIVAETLGGTSEPEPEHLREVTLAAAAKHHRVAELVRPKNAVVYFGVRARPQEYADEMPRYHEMIRQAEAIVHDLAKNPGAKFAERETPSLPPMEEKPSRDDGPRTGIIKSVAEQQAEFTVADGYEVNLFASEEQFPELRNPVQVAFDARGRLWVVTMPSFPHTVPGLTPPDKILILEDTDRDGKADKVTTYMEGLDALDGVAFHRNGVIISEQPRLWMTNDSDGDDRIDAKGELLRGIDVTDSHHGGMIATDPMGQVIFSDGVFHRSQLETPFGVHRGIDATTYRLNPNTGRINTEWQHNTPNPWNVTFDRWGNIFQMYGDGGSHDGAALIWTPFGSYHPYNYAEVGKYGKGSGFAVISSPNFPDEYSEGIASASLLGRYAVNLTKFDYSHGLIQHEGPLTILSSPNAAFRPADVEFGMDGALYVSDFCSPIIGHAQHPMRSPHWDHDYGRIWRIVHTGKPLVNDWPTIVGAGTDQLCELLTHPQDLVRKHARIELRKKGDEGLKAVDQWIADFDRDDENFDQAALEAVFVCGGLGETRPELVDALLKSDDAMFRGAAVDTIRLLADRLENVRETLITMAADPHPRVQLKVIGAVAHLRQTDPSMESVLAAITSDEKSIQDSLATMQLGTAPKKGRSVPVLEVDPDSEITHWMRYDQDGGGTPVIHTSQNPSGGDLHLFRTFVTSETAQPAILALNHKCLNVSVNDVLKFSQNSNWSSDQQIYIDLEAGQNVIEIELVKAKLGRGSGSLPKVYLYDSVGQALTGIETLSDSKQLQSLATAHEKMLKERGLVFRVQAAPGLQFSPKQLRVKPGVKVRVIFQNPDIMQHNFLLIAPGSVNEIGTLADQMAASSDGLKKQYIPDSDKVLIASQLISPQGEEELVFTAPTEPGEYPYICTFPGHWRVMQGVLTVAESKPEAAPAKVRKGKTITRKIGDGVVFETASDATGFKTLVPPTRPGGKVIASRKTNNDPIAVLTDGKLASGFGPIFGNTVKDGAYKMDLGKSQPVAAITSWSHNRSGKRGTQIVSLYGSNSPTDPGWNLADKKRFTSLGTISTKGQEVDAFAALSLQAKEGKSLGEFRWIVWQASPVTNLSENTAFQELAVETGQREVAERQATHAVKANEPLVYEGKSGPGVGKHIVFLANDHEYRSEQTCPAIARMLARHHGFRCTVLFGLNDDGHIHPGGRTVPGLEALKEADMLFLFSRFMNLPDEQVDHLADYLERGGPVVALRTSSHSFNGQSGKWAKLNFNYKGDDYPGGLGQNIVGVTWTDHKEGGQGHYGGNHSQGSRITLAESAASHPILTGVGEMHGYSGAYSSSVPPGATSLIELQVLNSFQPGGEPAKNKPIKTAGWYKNSYTAPSGTQKKARVVYTPFGASEDVLDENMRRFLTNASFWAMGMEKQITPDLEVSLVGKYRPSPYSTGSLYFTGVSPSQLAGWESAIMPANAELVGVDQQSEKGKQRIERIFKNRPEMAKDLLQKKETSTQPKNAWIIDNDADWALAGADSANLVPTGSALMVSHRKNLQSHGP